MSWLDRDHASDLIDATLASCRADEAEVAIAGGDGTTLRLAGADEVVAHSVRRATIHLRVAIARGGRVHVGSASADGADDTALVSLAERAEAAAWSSPPVQHWEGFAYPDEFVAPIDAAAGFDRPTATTGPAYLAEAVVDAVFRARQRGLHIEAELGATSGRVVNGAHGPAACVAVGTSHGLRVHHARTEAWFALACSSPEGGIRRVRRHAIRRTDLDAVSLAAPIVAQVATLGPPGQVIPRRYPVLFAAPAMAQLARLAASAIASGARPVEDASRSGAIVNLRQEPTHRLLAARPFDRTGRNRAALTLYDSQREVPSDQTSADRSRSAGADLDAVVLDVSSSVSSESDLVAQAGQALFVSDLCACRFVDVGRGYAMARTAGGFFELRPNGRWRPLRDAPLRLDLFGMLGRITAASDPARVGDCVAPATLVEDVEVMDA